MGKEGRVTTVLYRVEESGVGYPGGRGSGRNQLVFARNTTTEAARDETGNQGAISKNAFKTGWKVVSSKCGEEGLFRGTSKYYGGNSHHNSYVFAVKQCSKQQGVEEMNKPSLVLDDSCMLHRDFSSSLMGKVKDFGPFPNLKLFLAKEGFGNISIKYMGGFWVLIELLFWRSLRLMLVWTNNTFAKISSKWGEFLYDEDKDELCINNKREENGGLQKKTSLEGDSDAKEIPETIFDKEEVESKKKEGVEDCHSDDPFKIYDLLNKKKVISNGAEHSDGNLKYPPGFTPRDATKVYSNSVDKDSMEEKECDQNCYENEEVSVLISYKYVLAVCT
ncbi:hypothetical protein Tco_1346119 [Tanacetum coccineum]